MKLLRYGPSGRERPDRSALATSKSPASKQLELWLFAIDVLLPHREGNCCPYAAGAGRSAIMKMPTGDRNIEFRQSVAVLAIRATGEIVDIFHTSVYDFTGEGSRDHS